MKKKYIPFYVFLAVLLVMAPLPIDFNTSVVPGWHTSIFTSLATERWAIFGVLIIVVIVYWSLVKQMNLRNWIIFGVHLLLTLPAVILSRFPLLLFNNKQTDPEAMMKQVNNSVHLQTIAWKVFVIGQVLFLVYFVWESRARAIAKTGR